MTKKGIYITVASLALIVFGFFYNIYLFGEFNMENAANHLLIIVALLLGGIVASAILKKCNIKFSEIKIMPPVYIAILLLSAVIMFILKIHNINQTIINSIMIAVPTLSGCLCVQESVGKSYPLIRTTFVIGCAVGLSYALCTISTTVVVAIMLIVAKCFVITTIEKSQKIWWKLHTALVAVILTMCIGGSLISNDVVSQRLLWYFKPGSNVQFEIIRNLKLFNCILHSNMIEFFGSEAGVTHLHIANSLGIIASLTIILVQLAIVVCMLLQAKKFSGNQKLLGICTTVPVAIQSIVGMLSSFGLIPITEVGAPFVTTIGLEFCVLPIFWFLCLSFEGHGAEIKAMLKEFIFPTLDDFDEEFEQIRLACDSIEAILANYKCTDEDAEEIRELRDTSIRYAIEYVKAAYEQRNFDDSNYLKALDRLEYLLRKYNDRYLLKDCHGLMDTSLLLLYRNLSEGSKNWK